MVSEKSKKPLSPYLKVLMIMAGIISVGLGTIGIVVPILPTTPFFLLAAYLFIRSSARLYNWLINHRLFGNYIRNYILNKSISKGVKIFTLILLWGAILLSVYLTSHKLWLQLLLILIALAVSTHILSLRTTSPLKFREVHKNKNKQPDKQA